MNSCLRVLWTVLATGLALGALAAGSEPPLAIPIDGKPFPAALASCDEKWQLEFRAGDQVQTLFGADLVAWGAPRDPSRAPLAVLADGGILSCDVLSADKDRLVLDSDLFGMLKTPLEAIAGVVFSLPSRLKRDRLLDRLVQSSGDSDVLFLVNGDEIAGVFESFHDETVVFRAEVGELKIELNRIAALLLNPSLRRTAPSDDKTLRAWVGFADGSRLLTTKLVVHGDKASLTTALGKEGSAAAKEIVALQPLGGRALYLGSLKSDGYRQIPYLDLEWPYTIDRNVSGGWLRCGGRPYLMGIGMHSASRLSYAIDAAAKRFEAEIGIDDSTAGQGSVRFRVFVDGKQRFASDTIRGGDAPTPIVVELKDAKRLDLVIDYADKADVLDRADWLDARLVR